MATKNQETPFGDIRTHVRERYARAASGSGCGCSSPRPSQAADCCGGSSEAVALTAVHRLYQTPDARELPEEVTSLSLGCGDPVTLASLQPGQTVLDLGSGGGIDCFLAAKQVGGEGRVIGVDMTPEMLDRARKNKASLGAENVEFRLGEIEHLPVADASVDVVISNCVINLSPDKPQVFREAYRVLKPGGRFAVTDIVTDGPLPDAIKRDLSAWAGCVAGAWEASEYVAAMREVGFAEVSLSPTYLSQEFIEAGAEQLGIDGDLDLGPEQLRESIYSARVTATKPRWTRHLSHRL